MIVRPHSERMRRSQDARLRDLVVHAYQRVPLYRQLFDEAGIDPHRIRGVDDLPMLPPLERRRLQQAPLHDTLARGQDPRKLHTLRTSGTTGMPVNVLLTESELNWRTWCNRHRSRALLGYRSWVKRMDLRVPRPARWWQRTLRGLTDRRVDMSLPPAELLREIRSFRPRILTAYPSTFLQLGRELERTTGPQRLAEAYICSGEVLTPQVERTIERMLQARPCRSYASWEFGIMAVECRPGAGLHVYADNVIIEIDPATRSGPHAGELLITALRQKAMPLIRYRIGDFGVLSDQACSCGSPFPMLQEVNGRTHVSALTAGGQSVTVNEFYTGLRRLTYLDRYQLVQPRPGVLEARIEPNAQFTSEREAELRALLRRLTHEDMQIELIVTADFPPPRGGKFQLLVRDTVAES